MNEQDGFMAMVGIEIAPLSLNPMLSEFLHSYKYYLLIA